MYHYTYQHLEHSCSSSSIAQSACVHSPLLVQPCLTLSGRSKYPCVAQHMTHKPTHSMKASLPMASQPALPGVKNPAPIAASGSWLGRAAGSVALLRGDDKEGPEMGTPTSADKLAGKLQAQLVAADVSPPPAGGVLKLAEAQDNTPKKTRSLIPALRLGSSAPNASKGVQVLSEGPVASKKMLPNAAAKQLAQGASSKASSGQLMTL